MFQDFMIDALKNAEEMIRREGVVRPTFMVASADGLYSLVCEQWVLEEDDDQTLKIISSLLRWSMTRAFLVICEHCTPARIGLYVISSNDVEGFSVRVHKRPLRFGRLTTVEPPSDIQRLRLLIPSAISRLSENDVVNLEEVFGIPLEECRPYYLS